MFALNIQPKLPLVVLFLTIFRNTISCDSKGIFVMPRENQQQQQRK
jgi:hypothetical protein